MDDLFPISRIVGKIIKADNCLLLKIEESVIKIDNQDFKLLKLMKKIPLFLVDGSLTNLSHQTGFAFLEVSKVSGGIRHLDVIIIINSKVYNTRFDLGFEMVFLNKYDDFHIVFTESLQSQYQHLKFKQEDWENYVICLKKFSNIDMELIPDPYGYLDYPEIYPEAYSENESEEPPEKYYEQLLKEEYLKDSFF